MQLARSCNSLDGLRRRVRSAFVDAGHVGRGHRMAVGIEQASRLVLWVGIGG